MVKSLFSRLTGDKSETAAEVTVKCKIAARDHTFTKFANNFPRQNLALYSISLVYNMCAMVVTFWPHWGHFQAIVRLNKALDGF